MSMAQHAWKGMNGARRMQGLLLKWRPNLEPGTEKVLEQRADAPRDLRGWEWFYLASYFFRSLLMLREGTARSRWRRTVPPGAVSRLPRNSAAPRFAMPNQDACSCRCTIISVKCVPSPGIPRAQSWPVLGMTG